MNEMTFKRLSKEKTKNNSILLFENGKNGLFVFLCGESRQRVKWNENKWKELKFVWMKWSPNNKSIHQTTQLKPTIQSKTFDWLGLIVDVWLNLIWREREKYYNFIFRNAEWPAPQIQYIHQSLIQWRWIELMKWMLNLLKFVSEMNECNEMSWLLEWEWKQSMNANGMNECNAAPSCSAAR